MSNIIGYGELLLRLTPLEHGNLLEQSNHLEMAFAGAEANIIADLALLGNDTSFITALPNNPIGRAANQFLNSFNINTNHIIRDNGRMGVYYIEHGTTIRGTRVTYDRVNSSVCTTIIDKKNWGRLFAKATHFILTGITPALSKICRENINTALPIAKMKGVKVVFDLNYRRTLWTIKAARQSFKSILPYVDILIANTGSAYDVFAITTDKIEDFPTLKIATQQAAEKLDKLGNFDWIGMTLRLQNNANDNVLGGMIKKDEYYFSSPMPVQIVDRLGGGDAFAAAMLHGIIKKWSAQDIVNFSTAAFAVTQTMAGDINYSTAQELLTIANGNVKGYVQR